MPVNERGVHIIKAGSVERLPANQAIVGESIRWLPGEGCLMYVDILGKELRLYNPDTGAETRLPLDQITGSCFETSQRGILMLAQQDRLALFDLSTGEETPWCPLEEENPDTRGNDGRVDPQGRLWISTMDMVSEPRRPIGSLYRVGADGQMDPEMGNLRIPNALAFSPEGNRMYFADSPERMVWQFDRDPDTGALSGPRLFFEFGANESGIPDGACVDTDGCYWIAVPQGARVERRGPNGSLDTVIRLPAERPTMCAFGGPGLETLFVTSLCKHIDPQDRINHPEQGALYAINTGHQGIPETPLRLD